MSFAVICTTKEAGVTSFQSLRAVKAAYPAQKVGHTGTLDRFAGGLMIVLVGEATRLNPFFTGFDKSYRAVMRFGVQTDTLDPEGAVVRDGGRIPSLAEIEAVLPSFTGKTLQRPPVYSAIHVGGKRAYREARKGREIEMPEREIEISRLSLVSYDPPYLVFDASVSKGTYIRALARDIALSLGSCAHLTALDRYRVGPFDSSSLTGIPASLQESEANISLVIRGRINAAPWALGSIANGYFPPRCIESIIDAGMSYFRLYSEERFLGVVERKEDGRYKVVCLVSRENI